MYPCAIVVTLCQFIFIAPLTSHTGCAASLLQRISSVFAVCNEPWDRWVTEGQNRRQDWAQCILTWSHSQWGRLQQVTRLKARMDCGSALQLAKHLSKSPRLAKTYICCAFQYCYVPLRFKKNILLITVKYFFTDFVWVWGGKKCIDEGSERHRTTDPSE